MSLTVSDDGTVLSGKTVAPAFCTPWGTPYNSNVYFYAELDKPLKDQDSAETTVNTVVDGSTVLQYDLPAEDPTLTMRVGISSVSIENAELNLQAEAAESSLEEVRADADSLWNERLNTVQVDRAADPAALTEGQRADLVKFYTALYRVFGSPTVYSDVNGDFRSMEAARPLIDGLDVTGWVEERETVNVADYTYARPDGETGGYDTHYSGLSMWDSYRSHAQLLALLAPDVASEVAQSIVVDGLQCGALPHWVDASDDSTPMSGDNALPVLAGSYVFGARDFDLVAAARLVQQSVFDETSACNNNHSFYRSAEYLATGYFPAGEWTSANIERYNSDYAAAVFLSAVDDAVGDDTQVSVTDAEIADLYDRAGWWTNILDPESATLRSRLAPTEPGTLGEFDTGTFHESTEPNYFWSFGHAWDGLIDGIGGDEAAVARLNALFSMDDALTATPTLAQLNGGQEAETLYIGNEPSYQAPWAYNWAGKPAASQYVVSQVRDTAFGTGRDGMPGNDDMGAQSSWFVLASLGLFPVVPSDPGLAISTPLFPAATVWLSGEPVRMTTDGDPAAAPFIQSMTVDGHPYGRSWMKAETLVQAGAISFTLSSTPTTWAADVHPTAAAATTTTVQLSTASQEAGSNAPITAQVTVGSADLTLPRGTVEIRADGETVAVATVGAAAGSIDIPFTVPADTPVSTLQITAAFVPSDPSFLEPSVSEPVALEITPAAEEPTGEPTEEPTEEPTGPATDDPTAGGADEPSPTATVPSDGAHGAELPSTGAATTAWILVALLLAGGGLALRRRQSA